MQPNPAYNVCSISSPEVEYEIPNTTQPTEKPPEAGTVKIEGKRPKQQIQILALVIVFSVLGLLLVTLIAVVIYTRSEMVSLQSRVELIQRDLNLNQTDSSAIEITSENDVRLLIDSLQSSVDNLNAAKDTTATQLSSLQSSVDTLNAANDTTVTQLSSLQSSVDTLTTRVSSPMANLFQNCIQETRSCTHIQRNSERFWEYCMTPELPANTNGYYTVDMRCIFSPPSGQLDTTSLQQAGPDVQCMCIVKSRIPDNGELEEFRFPTFTCTLVVTRCPVV